MLTWILRGVDRIDIVDGIKGGIIGTVNSWGTSPSTPLGFNIHIWISGLLSCPLRVFY
jgi:hypothetical protein